MNGMSTLSTSVEPLDPDPQPGGAPSETGGRLVFRLVGEAGIKAAGDLERAVNRLMSRKPAALVIDVSGLQFLASLDIGLLVTLGRTVIKGGGKVAVAGARGSVLDSLTRSMPVRVMPVAATLDEARLLVAA